MAGFTYLINVAVNGGGAFQKLSGMAGSFENSLERVNSDVKRMDSNLASAGRTGRGAFDGMRSSLAGFAAQVGVAAFTLSSLNTTVDAQSMERAITFSGGAQGVENLQSVKRTIEELHLPIQGSLEGFKTLAGGMIGTGVTAQEQQDIFKGLGEAAVVMGLDAEQTKGSFLALSQMASKGTVSAEELRGQLGERLPGAFAIAARAMGVSTRELGKMMEQGKVVSAEFLPKFAAELHKTFGPGVQEALNGPRTAFNDFGNAIFDLKTIIGTELMPVATGLINNVFVPMVAWVGQNIKVLGLLSTTIGGVWLATKIYAATTAIAAFVTGGFTGAVGALTAAMRLNPIGFLISAFVALAGVVVYAWNTFAGFRGFLIGVWETIKEFALLAYERFIQPLVGGFKMLWGAMRGDVGQITAGWKDIQSSGIAWAENMGTQMTLAYNRGWDKGMDKFNQSATEKLAQPNTANDGALGGVNFSGGVVPGAGGDKDKGPKLADNITGGGQRNVTINIGEFGNNLTIHTTNIREGAEQVKEMLLKTFLQVINSANQVQTSNG